MKDQYLQRLTELQDQKLLLDLEQRQIIIILRDIYRVGFAIIATQLGISRQRAQQIYKQATEGRIAGKQ